MALDSAQQALMIVHQDLGASGAPAVGMANSLADFESAQADFSLPDQLGLD